MIAATDIQFVLSGGTYNNDPNKSLGGDPSLNVIWGTMNNLFDNVTNIEAEDGATNYRCFYVVNNNATDSFYDSRVFITKPLFTETYTPPETTIVKIGTIKTTDYQQVIVSGIAEGGSMTLSYDGTPFTVPHSLFLSEWANNFQTALSNLAAGAVVTVLSYPIGGSTRNLTRIFNVRFEGASNYRFHPILTLDSNDITGNPTIEIIKMENGSPINSIAAQIDYETIEPAGITWEAPTETTPLIIGTMRGGDSFPIWVQRITPAGTGPLSPDMFTFKVQGRPINS